MRSRLLDIDTVALKNDGDALVIIDQTSLPGEIRMLSLERREQIWEAIYRLQVRGAPAIGLAAAMGMAVLGKKYGAKTAQEFEKQFLDDKKYLEGARPTAVNLFWALAQMEECLRVHMDAPVAKIKRALIQKALELRDEDVETCRKIGEFGLGLLNRGDGVLTHCNAGKLATVKYGTATAPIYLGQERGYHFRVYADETRPLLQGARLTAFELGESGVDVTLVCDNMAASLMQKGLIQAVLVGCDRIAANGDTANKIGTLGLAVLAKHFQVPFYVCAPTSTIDRETKTGEQIVIESRPGEEIAKMWYEKPMAPEGACRYNPAFDVTPAALISGIVTENGVLRPDYTNSILNIAKKGDVEASGGS